MSEHSDQAAGEGWEDHVVGAKAIKLSLLINKEQKNAQKVHTCINQNNVVRHGVFPSLLLHLLLLRYLMKSISFKRSLIWLLRRFDNSLMVSQLW